MPRVEHLIRKAVLGMAALAASTSMVSATIVYNDGATHVIDTQVNDNVFVENLSQLIVDSGGLLIGPEGLTVARMRAGGGSLDVMGNGRIIAAPGQRAIDLSFTARSDATLRDRAMIDGEIFGAGGFGLLDESISRSRLYIQDQAIVNGNLNYGGFIRLEDQAVVLGNFVTPQLANVNMEMRGGVITGVVALGGLNDHRFTMQGGAILGGFNAPPSRISLQMEGGYIGNGFRSIGSVVGEISGGQIDGGLALVGDTSAGGAHLTLSGGKFNTIDGEWLLNLSKYNRFHYTTRSHLDIWGGEFGYHESGLGLLIDEAVDFSIHGRDLVYSDGWLTGYLMDGSWFSNSLTFGANWNGTFNIHNVPEPGTLALFLTSLLGFSSIGRRRIALSDR